MSLARDAQKVPKIIGQYQIDRKIGTGAMGDVYEATHLTLQKKVALKILRNDGIDGEARKRFLQEGVAACRVRHPNVVDVTDAGEHEQQAYLAMALLDGETLAECLQRQGRLPLTYCVDLMLPVCAALEAAHRAGVLHRDLKPGNLFLADVGRGEPEPMLLDFGISKILGHVDAELTQNPQFLGTPLYIAPEQADGAAGSPASDQYSLALTLYETLLGIRPYEKHKHSLIQLLRAVAEADIRPPRAFDPSIPQALEDALMRALSKDPARRFPTIREFGAALLPFSSTARGALWQHAFIDAERTMASASGPVSQTSSSRRVMVSVDTPDVPSTVPHPGFDSKQASTRAASPFEDARTTPNESFDAERSSISRKARSPATALPDVGSEDAADQDAGAEPSAEGPAFAGVPSEQPSSPARRRPVPAQKNARSFRIAMVLLALSLAASAVFATILVVRSEVGQSESFEVDVTTDPREAVIEIDGQQVGSGRFRGAYPKDGTRHRLVVHDAGYESMAVTFADVPPPSRISLVKRARDADEPGGNEPAKPQSENDHPATAGEFPRPSGDDASAPERSSTHERSQRKKTPDPQAGVSPLPESVGPSPADAANEPLRGSPDETPAEETSSRPAPDEEPRQQGPASSDRGDENGGRSIQTGNLDPWAR